MLEEPFPAELAGLHDEHDAPGVSVNFDVVAEAPATGARRVLQCDFVHVPPQHTKRGSASDPTSMWLPLAGSAEVSTYTTGRYDW